jgi:hypothetical protein
MSTDCPFDPNSDLDFNEDREGVTWIISRHHSIVTL